jgi:hypothetical protein
MITNEKVVNEPMKMPKFLHVAYHIHQQLFQDGMMISGFYNWHRVFKGDFDYENLNKTQQNIKDDVYDIIFVGISRPEITGCIISDIRHKLPKNSKAIIVACVDYAVEMWQGVFNPNHLKYELDQADFIFAAELSMVSHVKSLLPHRQIYHILHPTDIVTLKKMCKPEELRRNALLAIIHRYDNNWLDMHLATKNLDMIDVYGCMLDGGIEVEILPFFQFTKKPDSYGKFVDFLSEAKICIDSYHRMHSYGRMGVECACLKVPFISTTSVTSALMLWPETTIQSGYTYDQENMVRKVLEDKDFCKKVVDEAYKRVDICNYENSFYSFMRMIGKMEKPNHFVGEFIDKRKPEKKTNITGAKNG